MKILQAENKIKYDAKNITIILTHNCNFNCYYCYDKKNRENKKYIKINAIKQFIENYKKISNVPINIFFTGGEPTLHPELIEIYSMLVNNDTINKLVLITNGSYNNYENILKMNPEKINIFLSYHPKNKLGLKYYLNLLKKIYKYNVEVSYIADPEIELSNAYEIVNELQNYIAVDILPLDGYTYSKEYMEFIKKYNTNNLEITYSDGNKINETKRIIKTLNYNPFKGMYCESFKRNWIIDVDLTIKTACRSHVNDKKYYAFILKDIKEFYEKTTKQDMICISDECVCYMDDKKWL